MGVMTMSSESDRRLTYNVLGVDFQQEFQTPPNPTTQNCYPNTQMDQSLKVFQKKNYFHLFLLDLVFFPPPFFLLKATCTSFHTHTKSTSSNGVFGTHGIQVEVKERKYLNLLNLQRLLKRMRCSSVVGLWFDGRGWWLDPIL